MLNEKSHLRAIWCMAGLMAAGCGAGDTVPVASAQAAAAALTPQRVLLAPLEADAAVGKNAFQMSQLAAEPAPATIAAKVGQTALTFRGEAEGAGSKGDFTVSGAIPGRPQKLGAWMYLQPDANVSEVGFQFYDAEGEAFLSRVPADWTGWKWVEVSFASSSIVQAYPQADKNGKVDFPIKEVHIIWFAKTKGASALTVDGLSATTELDATPATTLQSEISGAAWGDTGQPLSELLTVTNFGAQKASPQIDYSLQHTSDFSLAPDPDPVYGSDEALGAKSWTEVEGRKIEEGSLTDGNDWTNVRPPFGKGGGTEAFQYVDLGSARRITRLTYQAGDGNWAWKLDIAASEDGRTYQPVSDLQGVDIHQKWGAQVFPDFKPFEARFLRLRYHKDGESAGDFAMLSGLSVYDGVADESSDFPKTGEVVSTGSVTAQVAPHDFALVNLPGDKPLGPGAYRLSVRVRNGEYSQVLSRTFLVKPQPFAKVSPASRFGLNTSDYTSALWHRQLGIGWVRFENLKWPMISPAPDTYVYSGVPPWNVDHDRVMSGFRAQGISVLPFLFQSPDYATSAPADVKNNLASYPPKDNAQMADFVFQTVARYGSKKHPASQLKTADKKSGLNLLNTFEIWNEPNLTDPGWGAWVGTSTQYNAMFRAAAEAVKRADPTARVTNGGTAGIDIEVLNTLLDRYADGKKPLDFVDVLNVHYYSGRIAPEVATNDPNVDRSGNMEGVRTYEEDLRRLIAWRDQHKPGIPIWMTETGYDSAGPFGTDERHQAARLPRVIMMTLAAGIDKVIVYRDSGSTASMHAASGVVRDDGSLKPSWFTYATLIRQLDGVDKGALRLPYSDPNVRLYAWTRGKETILTAWTIENPATLRLQLGQCTVTDAFGATRQTKAGDLPISMFPVYIRGIGNPAAFQSLVAQAKRDEAARQTEAARMAKLRAYLFDFGSTDHVGTIDIGDTHTFTPVVSSEIYDDAKGYGFFPGAASGDQDRRWINDPLERDGVRLNPGQIFRAKVKPGAYQLRVRVSAQNPARLTVGGIVGGERIVPISPDQADVALDIEAGSEPITISNDGYTDFLWLTLIERSGAAPAKAAP